MPLPAHPLHVIAYLGPGMGELLQAMLHGAQDKPQCLQHHARYPQPALIVQPLTECPAFPALRGTKQGESPG